MVREAFIVWILTAMTSLAPPHRPHYEASAQESFAQADARYREIAETIIDGVFSPDTEPVFTGQRGRQQTAMLVTVWWHSESGFRRDVDLGLARARMAKVGWNDFGRSWCMGQINLGRKKVPDPERPGEWIEDSPALTPEGWSGKELCADRLKCLQTTLRVMRQSINACRSLPSTERLAAYAAGHCASERGRGISHARMLLWQRLYDKARPGYTDTEVLAAMARETPDKTADNSF